MCLKLTEPAGNPASSSKNPYIATGRTPHLVNCLIHIAVETFGPLDAESLPVLLEVLPPGEWHFVRLVWLACSSFSVCWIIVRPDCAPNLIAGARVGPGKPDRWHHPRHVAG